MGGFDNIETLSVGEDQWQSASWKIKTAVSGMNGDLAQLLYAAETGGVRNAEEILKDDEFDGNRESASRPVCTVCWRGTTSSESSTIVMSGTGLDVE